MKVIVAGHSCLDITPVFPKNTNAGRSGMLTPGTLVEVGDAKISAGGAVSNTGIAMKLLGMDVSLLTKTGEDAFGRILETIYERYGVSDGILSVPEETTSYSVVIAIPGIDRTFLHNQGANQSFGFEDVKSADFTDVKLFHFGYPPIMKKMYQNEGRELIEMMKYVKSKGVITSLDLAAVDPASEAGKADWKAILKGVLPYVDIFVPSVEELCFMLDRERFFSWQERAAGGDLVDCLKKEDLEPLAEECMRYGTRVLLLKCGAPGLYYQTCSAEELRGLKEVIGLDVENWAEQKGFEHSYVPEKVLSATGAGDTTIAAFLTAMLKGYSLEMAVHFAAAEGASCVEAYDALGGLRSLGELEKKILTGWAKRA